MLIRYLFQPLVDLCVSLTLLYLYQYQNQIRRSSRAKAKNPSKTSVSLNGRSSLVSITDTTAIMAHMKDSKKTLPGLKTNSSKNFSEDSDHRNLIHALYSSSRNNLQ